jgi:hypothetical protein
VIVPSNGKRPASSFERRLGVAVRPEQRDAECNFGAKSSKTKDPTARVGASLVR